MCVYGLHSFQTSVCKSRDMKRFTCFIWFYWNDNKAWGNLRKCHRRRNWFVKQQSVGFPFKVAASHKLPGHESVAFKKNNKYKRHLHWRCKQLAYKGILKLEQYLFFFFSFFVFKKQVYCKLKERILRHRLYCISVFSWQWVFQCFPRPLTVLPCVCCHYISLVNRFYYQNMKQIRKIGFDKSHSSRMYLVQNPKGSVCVC